MSTLTESLHTALAELSTGLLMTQDEIAGVVATRYLGRTEFEDVAGTVRAAVRMHQDLLRARERTDTMLSRIRARGASSL